MANSIESQGIKLYYNILGSPSAYTAIGNVIGFNGPGGAASVIDVTNLDSLATEKRMGLPDEGQFKIDLNYDPDAASHIDLRNARKNRTLTEFKITLTDASAATNLVFFGYVLGFEISGKVNDVVKVSITIEITGAVSEV